MHISRIFCLLALALPLTAGAEKAAARFAPGGYTPPACVDGMTKNATISISFNGQENSLTAAREAFDKQRKEMEAEAAKLGKDQIKLTSFNYNLNSNNNYNNSAPNYNFSGNLNYEIKNEELAQKLSERLAELKRQFSMNINANHCSN